jgi:hypothetical protein
MMKSVRTLLALAALVAHATSAFTTPRCNSVHSLDSLTKCAMVKFNSEKKRWEADSEKDLEGAYGVLETVVRNGPLPFIQRITNGDTYEQAVLKYMTLEKVGRKEAQGNIDASLENAGDWGYQKMQEKKGAPKKDYESSPSPKQFALSGVWSLIVFWFFGSIGQDVMAGKYF